MLRLDRLTLTDFRNYEFMVWRRADRISVISGPNGTGKTNLLEAVSLLVPGRGLRGARLADLPRAGTAQWAVAARLSHGSERFEIGTGTSPDMPAGRRLFRMDGAPARNRAAIAERLCAVWLTPQMDRLFVEGASARRRFLDRLVLALDPDHAREVAAHDQAMQGRNRLLAQERADPAWLAAIEHALARHAVAVAAGRQALIARMHSDAVPVGRGFPQALLAQHCTIATRLEQHSALAVEDWLRASLQACRVQDAASGSSSFGAHRADMMLSDQGTGRPASMGSTGQQKALLVGVILAHASLIGTYRGQAPLLLLDEPLVHLDAAHRSLLFEALQALQATVLLTGTDAEPFIALAGNAEFLTAADGKLVQAS